MVTGVASVLLTTSTFPRDRNDPVSARFVLDLARHLAEHVRVTVLAPGAPGAPERERWDDVLVVRHPYFLPRRRQVLTAGEGILANVRESRLARFQLPLLVASQWAALPRVVRRESVDVVNAHWIVPQGFNAALWRRRLGFAHVVTAHAADVAYLRRSSFGTPLSRFILDRADHFLPVSSVLASQVQDLVGRPLRHRVVPMGVSPERFKPTAEAAGLGSRSDERVVLFVGKLVPKKGVEVLLDAVASLRRRAVSVRAVLVGGGPLEAPLRARVRELGIGEAVEMLGWRPNEELPGFYAAADVVCVPSVEDERGETEGMPVVVQEALAAGSLLVASEIAGIPDVVRDGRNGFLVPPGDPEALAEVLGRALGLAGERRRAVCARARDTALDHTWDRVAERYLEAFGEARGRTSGGSR